VLDVELAIDVVGALDVDVAHDGLEPGIGLQRHVGDVAIAIDDDVTGDVGPGVAELAHALAHLALLGLVARAVEDLPAPQVEVAEDRLGVVADLVEPDHLHLLDFRGRAFVDEHFDVDRVGLVGGIDVGGGDARVEEAVRAVVRLDGGGVEAQREGIERLLVGPHHARGLLGDEMAPEIALVDVPHAVQDEAAHPRARGLLGMGAGAGERDDQHQSGTSPKRHQRRALFYLWIGS